MAISIHFISYHFEYSNQSARELSHFAESAMAVKRVIMQHFSMKYDYMNKEVKERPNIYHPSRAGARADASTPKASPSQSIGSNDDDETLSNNSNNSNQSSPPPLPSIDNHLDDHSTLNVNDDSGNGDSDDSGEQHEMIISNAENFEQTARKAMPTPIKKTQMPSIEEQLNTVVRSLNEHQLQASSQNSRRPQNALKMYAASNGLGSIIEKLTVDDADASTVESQSFDKPQVIVNSGLDANAKYNVPSSNIVRHDIQDSQTQPKKLMAINVRNNIRPEQNWRYRSNSNSLENKQPTSKCASDP